ncbi:uncharacterized protein MONBRDRAFT_33213 [Monosiga brevicollis MX1]|uniref:Elongation of fatty acids protein n=1 Tax=Monosiga brevicollis TaxID=81824 RepID=A9V469_MONBE|nr:uncharacterized protein MONBRDRAFT_33213 [Monosiga brevicollis MX1]EDQ87654.1 predicted protein [Monosiga brevicollis MX1]|eukprot:XP_001747574.1 hypothetical protein [Monosiga brevicollis MX1]
MLDVVEHLVGYARQPVTVGTAWHQLWEPSTFQWQHGQTPLSHIVVVVAALVAYVVISFGLRAWMRSRTPFGGPIFKAFVVLHNATLSGGSAIMVVGCAYATYEQYRLGQYDDLVEGALCDSKHITEQNNAVTNTHRWWLYVFYLSKFYEMIDTFILALKKKDLTFLQMYHHAIIVLLCWSWIDAKFFLAWYAMVVNATVHTFMYYYFGCQALGVRVWWKKWLTTGQLVQFGTVFMLLVVYMRVGFVQVEYGSAYPFLRVQNRCQGEAWAPIFSQLINVTFLYLFGELFVRLYHHKPTSKPGRAKKD